MRVVVAGMGFMGSTHARAWLRVPGVELAVVSRGEPKPAVTGNFASGGELDWSAIARYQSLDEALGDAKVDAVDICLPTELHAETAIRALDAGKHCLVEKPLALTVADAERVAAAAERARRVLMCGQVLRFHPAYVAAREWVRKRGPVKSALLARRCATPDWSEWLRDPERSGGGAFDLLIHDADFARWTFGMPRAVWSSGDRDRRTGLLSYEGFQVTVTGGWYPVKEYPFSMGFLIACDGGTVEFVGGVLSVGGEVLEPPAVDMFEAELREFAACVEAGAGSVVCPAEESVDAVRLMRRIVDGE